MAWRSPPPAVAAVTAGGGADPRRVRDRRCRGGDGVRARPRQDRGPGAQRPGRQRHRGRRARGRRRLRRQPRRPGQHAARLRAELGPGGGPQLRQRSRRRGRPDGEGHTVDQRVCGGRLRAAHHRRDDRARDRPRPGTRQRLPHAAGWPCAGRPRRDRARRADAAGDRRAPRSDRPGDRQPGHHRRPGRHASNADRRRRRPPGLQPRRLLPTGLGTGAVLPASVLYSAVEAQSQTATLGCTKGAPCYNFFLLRYRPGADLAAAAATITARPAGQRLPGRVPATCLPSPTSGPATSRTTPLSGTPLSRSPSCSRCSPSAPWPTCCSPACAAAAATWRCSRP